MKKPFFARYGLLILMAVFFLAPFAMRGARMAVQRMKNDVKDWLPSDFAETTELDWFRDHFLGEQFVVVSWEGCRGDSESFMTFVDKFFPEIPPSMSKRRGPARRGNEPTDDYAETWPSQVRRQDYFDDRLGMYVRQLHPTDLPPEDEFIGNRLGILGTGDYHLDWGGRQEKWLRCDGDQWVYITPAGELYSWKGGSSILQPLLTAVKRMTGNGQVQGQFLTAFGPDDGPWYYEDPSRLAARLFKSVTTGPGVLHQLTSAGGALEDDHKQAMGRLRGNLFGPDGRQTCLLVTLTDAAKRDLRQALGRGVLGKPQGKLLELAEQSGIQPPPRPSLMPPIISWLFPQARAPSGSVIKMGGPPVDNVAIDEEGQITLVRLVGLSLLVGLGLSWISFRSVNVTIMVFFVGGLSAMASLSFVYWSGHGVDAVLMSMPSLVYVLGLSGAVHIVNYYRESIREDGLTRAPGKAIALGWKPCTLAAVTTSLGLLSLCTSNILPIRKFGMFSAIGVLATLVLLFTYLPSALYTWPPRRYRRTRGAISSSAIEKSIVAVWQAIGRTVIQRCGMVSVLGVLTMLAIGWGLTRIDTDVQLLKMFDANAKIIKDYKWLESNLGNLVPMEVVIRVAPSAIRAADQSGDSLDELQRLSFLERMEIATYVQEVLDRQLGQHGEQVVGPSMSAASFAPELPRGGASIAMVAQRGGISGRMEARRDEFLASDYLRIDKKDGSELWRISLRLGALQDVDYGVFVDQLKQTIEPVLAAYRYRDQILEAVHQQRRGDVRKARIYLVGAHFGKSSSADSLVQAPTSKARPDSQPETGISQTAIFAKILGRLLRSAGLDIRDWHDPRFEIPGNWPQTLGSQDCVVLLGGSPRYDVNFIQKHAPAFVDARNHAYDPSVGSITAHQRDQNVAAVYTGLVPIVYKAQRTLLRSLMESTGWAFVMIAFVMIFVVRSVRAGLLSMLPNVFPVVVVFGFMGWSSILVDIGSMMTASVAMGVAVDDTIHFLTWFRHGLDQGLNRQKAVLLAYRRVAVAMTQTTAIGGLGLSIFAFSTFTPTQRFGTLMLAMLLAALVGDLIFLPALLASPLGSVFHGRSKPPTDCDSSKQGPRRRTEPAPHSLGHHAARIKSTDDPRAGPISDYL